MKQIEIRPGYERSTYSVSGSVGHGGIWKGEDCPEVIERTTANDEILYEIYSASYPLQTTLTIKTGRCAHALALIWAGQFIEAADSVGMKTEVRFREDEE